MKKEEKRPLENLKIIENPLVFVAFSALGRSSRRPERRPKKQKIVEKTIGFITYS